MFPTHGGLPWIAFHAKSRSYPKQQEAGPRMVGWQGNIVLILLVIGMVTPTIWLQTSCLAFAKQEFSYFYGPFGISEGFIG